MKFFHRFLVNIFIADVISCGENVTGVDTDSHSSGIINSINDRSDETGRVVNPRVEKASYPEFEKPALEAVRQWKFEPAIKGGKRVSCRMRVPFRFQPK